MPVNTLSLTCVTVPLTALHGGVTAVHGSTQRGRSCSALRGHGSSPQPHLSRPLVQQHHGEQRPSNVSVVVRDTVMSPATVPPRSQQQPHRAQASTAAEERAATARVPAHLCLRRSRIRSVLPGRIAPRQRTAAP